MGLSHRGRRSEVRGPSADAAGGISQGSCKELGAASAPRELPSAEQSGGAWGCGVGGGWKGGKLVGGRFASCFGWLILDGTCEDS